VLCDTICARTISHLLSASLLAPHQHSSLPVPVLHGATAGAQEAVAEDDNSGGGGDGGSGGVGDADDDFDK
jgi:hypothetical protein